MDGIDDIKYAEVQPIIDKLAEINTAKYGCIIPPEEQYMILKSFLKQSVDLKLLQNRLDKLEQQFV